MQAPQHEPNSLQRFIHLYAWFILKNALGWLLILASLVLGPAIPGPGGIPLFLVGFAMITFPGKRRLIARVLRGRVLSPATRRYRLITWVLSLALPAIAVILLKNHADGAFYRHGWQPNVAKLVGYVIAAALILAVCRLSPVLLNGSLRIMPKVRRKIRPTLRHMGIRLLPPRWHIHPDRRSGRMRKTEEEIVHFGKAWSTRMRNAWKRIRPWLPKVIGLIVVPLIFYRLLRPIVTHWDDIQPRLSEVRWDFFALACLMFAANQFFCRVTSWRAVLHGLGWNMPVRPAARVWATSELVRYVPGVIWQVLGRAFLAKPYGIPMSTCSISQILEITIYLLANVVVAVGTLSLVSGQIADERTRLALRLTTVMIPALLLFLHPRIFYPVVNFILKRLGKPLIQTRLSGKRLLGLLLLAIVGQLWLGLAIWVTTYPVLKVELQDAWILSGAYCLAWTSGFCLASIAPSGAGIREIVLSGTLVLVAGGRIGVEMDPTTRNIIFAAIALLLRLWATVGELIFAAVAAGLDIPGARGRVQQVAKPV